MWPAIVEGRDGVELQRAFVELRRVLVQTGTVWLRLADVEQGGGWAGVPWRVVLALQAAGWIVRNAVVLQHRVPPVSERRRLEQAHDLVFLLAKSRTYYFDRDSLREDSKGPGDVWTSASVSRCIEAACPPGGTVLDPFCRTSATADAARRLGRRFVGITTGETRWAA
ncbi:site-specific DNA-methyltransferase [Lentzea sp. NBRC 105346]|uniref:site-specific DNA-methyltransferase n=1 Tax=Lentzea sp. NBRC 105346 TaxID=3032205 RepID=UPI002552F3C9|nr:site-specific DNA-methyltransferase [Lentzea sp. NBRC 105346]